MLELVYKWLKFLRNRISNQCFIASEYSQVQMRCMSLCEPFRSLQIAFIYSGFYRASLIFDHFERERRHLHFLADLQVTNKHYTIGEESPHFALATQKPSLEMKKFQSSPCNIR